MFIASQHANLGLIAEERGEIEAAREQWKKALAVFERCGMKSGADNVRGWLDELPPPLA